MKCTKCKTPVHVPAPWQEFFSCQCGETRITRVNGRTFKVSGTLLMDGPTWLEGLKLIFEPLTNERTSAQ